MKLKGVWLCAVWLVLVLVAFLWMTRCEHVYGTERPMGKSCDEYVFVKVCTVCGKQRVSRYKALLTFVDDDAKADALKHWETIIDATGITMTSAVIPSKVRNEEPYEGFWSYADWKTIHRLQGKGVDFVNHTYNHKNLTKLNKQQLRTDFHQSQSILRKQGLNADILVYPNNAYNKTVLSVAPEYFRAAVTCGGETNDFFSMNKFTIHRVNLHTEEQKKPMRFGNKTVMCEGTLSKSELDRHMEQAIQSKSWLIFMSHAYTSPAGRTYFDKSSEDTIIDFCNQVQQQGAVKIINLTQGVDMMEIINTPKS